MEQDIVPYYENETPDLSRLKFRSSFKFYVRSSFKEMRRRKVYYCLALFSVLIVVAATTLSQTIIDYAPLILMKNAESSRGAKDVVLNTKTLTYKEYDGVQNKSTTKSLYLNMTQIETLTQKEFPEQGTARFYSNGDIMKPSAAQLCTPNTRPPYGLCLRYAVTMVFQNTARENAIGLGEDNNLPNEIPKGQIIMGKKLAHSMGVGPGDTLVAYLDFTKLLKSLVLAYNFQQEDLTKRIAQTDIPMINYYIPFKVFQTVDAMIGKFPDDQISSTIIYEYRHLFQHLADNIPLDTMSDLGFPDFLDFVRKQNPQEFADEVIFNLRDRRDVYGTSNFDKIQGEITKFASRISAILGVFPVDMSLPIYEELQGTKFAGLFLGLILNVIIIVLFILSVILIYNLLMVSVETRTFEMGVLRMLGLDKRGIVELVIIQALTFVIPGIIIGLLVCFPLLKVLSSVIGEKLNADLPDLPTPQAFGFAVGIGFLIPLISSYYPMKEALAKNLNQAIDTARSKTSGVKVTIELDAKKFSWPKLTFGLLTVVFGIAVYILIPMSLLYQNMGLLLGVFFAILIGILFGLVLLTVNFQHLMERLITGLFFFWTGKAFRTVIIKNLVAHKMRNRKTAIMYALSLGFVIFVTVSLTSEIKNMGYTLQQRVGALIQVDRNGERLNKRSIENYINTNLKDVVESYSFITQDLDSFLTENGARGAYVTHEGMLYNRNARIVGVMPNIFDTTLNEYLDVHEQNEDTGLNLGEQLYTPKGMQSAIIGAYYADYLKSWPGSEQPIVIKVMDEIGVRSEKLHVLATMNSAPAFSFSKTPSNNQHVLVSMPTYLGLAGSLVNSIKDIPTTRILFKVYNNSDENLDILYSGLVDFRTKYYPSLDIFDFRDHKKSLQNNQDTMRIIFVSIMGLVFILCLFSLITSMSTNILEQTKEIAVLRAIGLTKRKVIRVYIAEAFVLVFSSALFGVAIGVAVSWIMTLQRSLFTQVIAHFAFPWFELLIIFIGAVISSFASTYFPARKIVKHEIAKIARMG